MIAKTDAAGSTKLLPEVLAFTSSLALDRALLREDLIGSLAHLIMLSRQGIILHDDAERIRSGLVEIWRQAAAGTLELPEEEDVHMAIEAWLTARLGEVAGLLHTARSRNDQVSLDLHLSLREVSAQALEALARLVEILAERATPELETILPAYTHRQRAQPISLAYLLCSYGAMFARDGDGFSFALSQVDALPLGVGACAGTSLPIDRELTCVLLHFASPTVNGLDTVGDRDFVLDTAYVTARCLNHAGRMASDFVDFTSSEYAFVRLDGEIACGSSMMPHKRNPDVFELIRAKSGRAIGNLMSLFATLKGLPVGYNRDLQEDRSVVIETGTLLRGVLEILPLALAHVTFMRERLRAAIADDYTQATDVVEALVKKGTPFRTAYRQVGALVRACQDRQCSLAEAPPDLMKMVHPLVEPSVLVLDESLKRKESPGGTGPKSVARQIAWLREQARVMRTRAQSVPRLATLFHELEETHL